jgi:hypothetical protein
MWLTYCCSLRKAFFHDLISWLLCRSRDKCTGTGERVMSLTKAMTLLINGHMHKWTCRFDGHRKGHNITNGDHLKWMADLKKW